MDFLTTCTVCFVLLLIYHYLAKKYQYFLSKPVECLRPTMLFGSSAPLLFRCRNLADHIQAMYNTFPDSKIIGHYEFTQPVYMLRDLDMIKQVIVKDFDYFSDHAPHLTNGRTEEDAGGDTLFGNSLFALRGQKWRDMRATLSPAFTGAKMRHMFQLVVDCGRSMTEFFKAEAKTGKRLEYELKDVFSRYGNDVIASVAFGVRVDSMRDPENEFYVKGKQMLDFSSMKLLAMILVLRVLLIVKPKLNVDIIDGALSNYFKRMITDNMRQRTANGIVRDDMIQILMDVRSGKLKHHKEASGFQDTGFATVEESAVGKSTHSRVWNDNELIAQCFLFFLAGFETTSTLLTFLFYELTINPDIQQRLYEEIQSTEQSLKGEPISYEVLRKMIYMDMVVSEALRKWSPNMVLDRYCNKDYLYDDGAGTRFTIEKGVTVTVPVIALHRDPKYFPNPEQFDPERFSEENRSRFNSAAYVPFGVGPRNCIGSRLALMEVKSIVYHLLRDFRLEPTEKTQVPLKMAKHLFALVAEDGVWVELKPRKSC